MSTTDYAKRQSARDSQYEREYRAWIESLPPEERRKLEAQGLATPCVQRHGTGSARGDAADSPMMREGDDPMLLPDEPEPEPEASEPDAPSPAADPDAVWRAIRRLMGEIICHDNARLTAECVAIASGLNYSGCSMTDVAKRHGITRAAVSKRCVELTELLDLRPSRAMRSLTARESYRQARIQSNHRPK